MKQKLLLAALMLSMSLSLFAQSGTCGDNLTWNLSNGVLTISGTGDMTNYSYYSDGWGNSSTNAPWYSNIAKIKSVVISDGVTSIGDYAFRDCSSLTSVTIPNSVTGIGERTFSGCSSLTAVNISDLAAWCKIAFSDYDANPLYYAHNLYLNGTLVTDLVISDGVTSIGDYAFRDCSSLTSVTIPNSVTSIGSSAFSTCSSLTSVTIPSSVTSIGEYAFYGCSSLTSVTIGNGVTSIEESAFDGCSSLTSVTIPNSVTTIRERAFDACSSLTSVTIGNSVAGIWPYAFRGCDGITTITVYAETPPSVSSGTEGTFYGLTLSNITLHVVPTQWIPLYKYDPVWKKFNIQGIDATDQQYTITWKNYDGSVLETDENVAGGTVPTYNGATPVKPADDHYIYTFAGWSPAVVTVTGNATYVATYTATFKENTYIIHVNQDCTSYMEEQQ